MTPRPTQVVFFDAGNTLFTEKVSRDEAYAEALGRFGVEASVDQVAAWRADIHDDMPERFEGHVRFTDGWFRQYMARLLRRAGSDADPEALRADLGRHFSRPETFVVFEDTFDALDDLATRGFRLGVISNWSARLAGLLDGLRLTPYFEAVVISAVVGYTKPDTAIFTAALELLETPAATALYVGDHPLNDVQAARQAGLEALLIDRQGGAGNGPEVIRSLAEVADRIAPA